MFYVTAVTDRQYIRDKATAIKVTPFTPKSDVTVRTRDCKAAATASGSSGLFSQLNIVHPDALMSD